MLGQKKVVELGSGPGLGGLIAARWAKSVLLTDYQDLVMDLIETNIKKCNPNDKCLMLSAKLDWTRVNEEKYFENIQLVDGDSTVRGSLTSDFKPDVLIGTDVVYWRNFIVPLVDTLEKFFETNPILVFFICYIERHKITHIELLDELNKRQFKVEEIG